MLKLLVHLFWFGDLYLISVIYFSGTNQNIQAKGKCYIFGQNKPK